MDGIVRLFEVVTSSRALQGLISALMVLVIGRVSDRFPDISLE